MSDVHAFDRAEVSDRATRGFDSDTAFLPHVALQRMPAAARRIPAEGRRLSRPPVPEDFRGTFAAIEALAGWWRAVMPCDPDSQLARDLMRKAAAELEDLTAAIRETLDIVERTAADDDSST